MLSTNLQHPIRVAIIGLSASAVSSWAAEAHLPALQSVQGTKHFHIVALCNSSVEAAEAAKKHYQLPASVKAYGDVNDLANDSDIDMVICCTRVDKHYDHVVTSIKAGKDIFVEWPVASNSDDVRSLVELGKQYNVRIAVGLQGRDVPPVRIFRQILQDGTLGKLLSSELRLFGGVTKEVDAYLGGWEYFADKKIGGNHITIHFAHALDQVLSVVGRFVPVSTTANAQVQFPQVRVLSSAGQHVKTVDCDVPDLLYVHGTLPATESVAKGATLSASYHSEQPLPGCPALTWTMNCEKGIVRLDSMTYPSMKADAFAGPVNLRIRHHNSDTVEDIPWSRSDEELKLPRRAIDTLASLVAFAEHDDSKWVDISEAVDFTQQLESWIDGKSW